MFGELVNVAEVEGRECRRPRLDVRQIFGTMAWQG